MVTAEEYKDGKNSWRQDLQVVVKNSEGSMIVQESLGTHVQQGTSTMKKRPGRPRKGMERLLPPEPKKESPQKEEKPKEPLQGTTFP